MVENVLNARVQHAVIGTGDGDTSTDSTPKKGEIVFNSTLDNFRVGNGTDAYSLLSDIVKKYNLTLNGTIEGDTGGTSLGTLYAPTSNGNDGQVLKANGSGAPTWNTLNLGDLNGWPIITAQDYGKILIVTQQGNLEWTSYYNYSFAINNNVDPVNRITITKSAGGQSVSTYLLPKLYYKNSATDSGTGTATDIRLYAGDNITLTNVDESVTPGESVRSGVKIDANVTTIPKATTASLGGIKLKSNTTIPSVNSPISSGNAYPIQLTSEGVAGVVFSTTELVSILNQLVDEARNNPSLRTQLASFFTGLTNITEQVFKDAMGAAFNTILSWYRTQS